MELDEVLSRVAADGIEFVRFEQSDLHDISRSKTVPARHAAAFAREGLNFLLGQLGFDTQGDELEKDAILRELLGEELIATFLAVERHEVAKAAEHVRDYGAADWPDRVDEFETDELFEFL
jgi:glutamine synthetase